MKSNKKLFAVLACVTALANTNPTSAYASSFTDLGDHWARQTIERLASENIITGMGDGTFAPNANVTRAQYFTMVNRAFNFTNEAQINFRDVGSGDWIETAMKRAVGAGYLKGYEDNTARPNENITRAEVAMVLKNVLNLPEAPGAANGLNDAYEIPEWSRAAVDAVVGAGLARGDDRGNYRAQDKLTRAESATMIMNALTYERGRTVQNVTLPTHAPAEVIQTNIEHIELVRDARISNDYGSASSSEVINGNVTIDAGGVTVRNIVVKGDLIIEESVKGIDLRDVVVEGSTRIHGSDIEIEASNSTFADMVVTGERSFVGLLSSRVENLHITNTTVGTRIFVGRGTEIGYATVDAASTFTGNGKIVTAMVNVSGVRVQSGIISNFETGSRRPTQTSSSVISGGGSGGGSSISGGGNGGGNNIVAPPPVEDHILQKAESSIVSMEWGVSAYIYLKAGTNPATTTVSINGTQIAHSEGSGSWNGILSEVSAGDNVELVITHGSVTEKHTWNVTSY